MMPLVPNSPSLEGMFDLGAKASPDAPADGVAFSSLLSQLVVPADGAANPFAVLTGETEAAPETSEDKSGQALIAGLALAATLPMRKGAAPTEAQPEGQDGEPGKDESASESDQPQAQAQPDAALTSGLVAPLTPTIATAPQGATAAAPATDAKAAAAIPAALTPGLTPALPAPDAPPQGRADMREILATIQTALTPGAAAPAGTIAPKLDALDGKKSAERSPAKSGVVKAAEADLTALAATPTPHKAHDVVQGLATAPVAALDASSAGAAKVAGPDAAHATVENQLDLAHESEWLDRLAKDIARSANSEGTLRFKLHPENLGKLQVELSQSDAGASVRMTTDTESARAIIADAQPRLIAEARAQGVRIAESHVDLNSGGGNNNAAQNQSGQRGNAQDDHSRKINQERAEVRTTATTSRLASERYA